MAKHPAAVALGRLGGRVTSARKAAASRLNGRKGGRPAWYTVAAAEHRAADAACGRAWSCACGACRAARKAR